MTTSLVVQESSALASYGQKEELEEMTDRLISLHPAANEVGKEGMRAVAQLAILVGASPLPSTNEIHVWHDPKKGVVFNLGINFYRRKCQEWGGILWDMQPRQMNDIERREYGVPQGVVAGICKAIRVTDMEKWISKGVPVNEIYKMCGATGIATVNPKEYPKNGRPLTWTVLKRAEIDMYRQLFPIQMSEQSVHQASQDDEIEVEYPEESLDDFNHSLFGHSGGGAIDDEILDGDFVDPDMDQTADEVEDFNQDNEQKPPIPEQETTPDFWRGECLAANSVDSLAMAYFQLDKLRPSSSVFKNANMTKLAIERICKGAEFPQSNSLVIGALDKYSMAIIDGANKKQAVASAETWFKENHSTEAF